MSNDVKWLLGSDFHIPYENPRYVSLWWQVMEWFEPDVIDILGDLDDNSACSKYSDGTPDEVINAVSVYAPLVKNFFEKCREIRPEAEIHFATGNHEARYDSYLEKKGKALVGLITPELLWGTDTYGIDLSHYNNPPIHRFGDIYVHHGIYSVANTGTKMLDEFGVSIIQGHSHRASATFRSYPLRNEQLRAYEIGHMTDIYSSGMSYDRKHNWQAGFAIAHIVNDFPHIQLISINSDFEAVVDGKLFKA